ncbi:MAG: serine hydrolase domain-containing protein, partial [Anaerolineaceae bacterium]
PQMTPLGALYSYNNAAFNVIGRVIEVITGKNYHAATQEMLLEPMALNTSCFFGHDVMLHRFALGHNTQGDQVVIAKPWFESRCDAPCGGLSSSAEEMLRYARFHMGDGRTNSGAGLLAPESLAQMQTPQLASEDAEQIGLNWFICELDGVRICEHGGSSNGQQAGLWFAPSKQTAFTVLTNLDRGSRLIDVLNQWVEENILGVFRPQRQTRPLPADELTDFAGMYLFAAAGDLFSVTIADGGLTLTHILQNSGRADDGPFGIPRQAIPPFSFFSCGEDLFLGEDGAFKGSLFEFLRDPSGRVMWLRFGGRVFNKQISAE